MNLGKFIVIMCLMCLITTYVKGGDVLTEEEGRNREFFKLGSEKRGDYYWNATVSTSMGDFKMKLYLERAPTTVSNFMKYVNDSFYDGIIFHRVIDDFVIQTGAYYPGLVYQAPTYPPIPLETHPDLTHVDGAVGMARTSDPDSATSQFYVCDGAQHFLDGDYAVFGQVIEGMSVVRDIAAVATHDYGGKEDVPVDNVTMNGIDLEEPQTPNTPPELVSSIPDVSFDEDAGNGQGLLDLAHHFGDDAGVAGLDFSLSQGEGDPYITPSFNGTKVDFTQEVENWFGTRHFKITATDDEGLSVESNEFAVTVDPTNDPPEFKTIDGKAYSGGEVAVSLDQGQWKNFSVVAEDIDGDTVTYSSDLTGNLSGFTVSDRGEAAVLGTQEGVGVHNGLLYADDGNGSQSSAQIKITINDVNDPPVLLTANNVSFTDGLCDLASVPIDQGETFDIVVRAMDHEGDSLSVSDLEWNGSTYYSSTGTNEWTIKITPGQEEVGISEIEITVCDINAAATTGRIRIKVNDVNDPPVFGKVEGDGIVKAPAGDPFDYRVDAEEGSSFVFYISATDPEEGIDSLTLTAGTQDFAVVTIEKVNHTFTRADANAFEVSVAPKEGKVGDFDLVLGLSDGELEIKLRIRVSIFNRPEAPVISNIEKSAEPEGGYSSEDEITLSASASDNDPGQSSNLSYSWSSDLDGGLGEGEEISVRLSPGTHNITLTVKDRDGNTTTRSFTMEVTSGKKAEGNGKGGETDFGFIIIAAIVVIAILAVALIYLRKRKKGREMTSEPPMREGRYPKQERGGRVDYRQEYRGVGQAEHRQQYGENVGDYGEAYGGGGQGQTQDTVDDDTMDDLFGDL